MVFHSIEVENFDPVVSSSEDRIAAEEAAGIESMHQPYGVSSFIIMSEEN